MNKELIERLHVPAQLEPHCYVLRGTVILHHKFCIMPLVTPMTNKDEVNDVFGGAFDPVAIIEQKEQMAKAYWRDGDVMGYAWTHERPYRMGALMEWRNRGGVMNAEFASAARSVWVDSENVYENHNSWRALFSAIDPADFMDRENLDRFLSLPEHLVLYRGCKFSGMSWTTDPEVAVRFAERTGGEVLREAWRPHMRFAYIGDRSESEVIVLAPAK